MNATWQKSEDAWRKSISPPFSTPLSSLAHLSKQYLLFHLHLLLASLYIVNIALLLLIFIPLMASASSPNQMEEMSVLQKHVSFFDRNQDGLIYPWETFQGFRAIGCGIGLSTFASIFINMGLSAKTRPGKFPSLLFPIEVKNIARGKHGSDSGVYDKEGRFVSSKFEDIFRKHSHVNSDALTAEELSGLLKANREPKDFGGRIASWTEWKILYLLGKDKNGLLHKDTVRAVYDGSLFEHMEKKRAESTSSSSK